LIFIACGRSNSRRDTFNDDQVSIHTGELIEIDFSDSNYSGLQSHVADTVTEFGWIINYLVRDDSTKCNDVYIKCSNGEWTGTYKDAEVLLMRRYFIPVYAGESSSFIYFTHGCATDCSALLVFSKDSNCQFKDYNHVIDYSVECSQVLHLTDSDFENENQIYQLSLIELTKDKTHKISYNNICQSPYKPSCIDTVIFEKSRVTVKSSLLEKMGSDTEIKQTKIVDLQ